MSRILEFVPAPQGKDWTESLELLELAGVDETDRYWHIRFKPGKPEQFEDPAFCKKQAEMLWNRIHNTLPYGVYIEFSKLYDRHYSGIMQSFDPRS